MIQTGMEKFAEIAVGRMINSLPEGVLIALGVSLLLRLMWRQNSGTRFAVWLMALVAVVALPFLPFVGMSSSEHLANFRLRSELVFPSFWAMAFLVVWLFLACVALARLAVGLWQIRQFRKRCTEISLEDLGPESRSLVEASKKPIRLLVSDEARVPAALGFLRPTVVLPTWILQEFSPTDLQPILIHELAHLRRYDSWTNLFQKAARALFFFHPAVWWIDSRLSLEREMACDDAVLTTTINPCAYAASLIGLLEKSCNRRGWIMAQAVVTRAREASQRISRILSTKGSVTTRTALPALGLATGLFLVCGGIASRAPRLLSFAPEPQSAHSSVKSRLVADEDSSTRVSGVISASFHPTPRTGFVRKVDVMRVLSRQQQTHRIAKPKKTRRATTPFVMTSVIQSGDADRSARTIMMIETSTVLWEPTASDQPYGNVTGHQQGRPNLQTLQFIQEDSAGSVRIWITMPGPDAIRHDSISFVI